MSKIVTWCIGLALAGALAGCGQSAVVRRPAHGARRSRCPGWAPWARSTPPTSTRCRTPPAIKLPGLAALNKGGFAKVNSVSCAPAGNCAAGGLYSWRGGFVAAEQNGSWGKAIKVPGLNAPNAGQVAEVVSVSCASVSLTALTAS